MFNLEMVKFPEVNLFLDKPFSGTHSLYHFFDIMPIGISITTDISCKKIRHNPKTAQFLRINDWSSHCYFEFDLTNYEIFRHGWKLSPYEFPLQRAMWLGEEIEKEELDFFWQDGVRKIGLWSARPIRDDNGSIIGAIAVCEDITQRRLEEEKLKVAEERFRKCLNTMLDCLSILKAERNATGEIIDLRYEYINDPGCKDHNLSYTEHIGRRISEIHPSYIESGLSEMYCRVIETGEPLELDSLYLPNATMPTIIEVYDIKATKLDDGIAVSWRNITEKKKLENEMGRLDRLNAVGAMAASIGHEIRNPLTTVRGYLQLFERKKDYQKHHEQFHTMIEELDRANHIITEFLSLAKNKVSIFERVNLNDIINTLLPLLQADAFRNGHAIRTELGDIPELALDKKEIRQVLLNLVRNGEEAMSSSGTIVIKTGLAEGEVFLSVQDSGPGIPKNVLDNIGTPFFTTKDSGTGLGLAVCYRIAQRHNAKTEIKTGLDGTTFILKFSKEKLPEKASKL